MENYESQKQVIKAIETIVDSRLSGLVRTTTQFGVVLEDPEGFSVKVKTDKGNLTCILQEDLHTWIQKDDVVIVQDLYGDGRKLTVTGKTGHTRTADPSLVFYNPETGHNESGVDGVFEDGMKITYATVDEHGTK